MTRPGDSCGERHTTRLLQEFISRDSELVMIGFLLIIGLNREVWKQLMQVFTPKEGWQQGLQLVRPCLCDCSVKLPLRFQISYLHSG